MTVKPRIDLTAGKHIPGIGQELDPVGTLTVGSGKQVRLDRRALPRRRSDIQIVSRLKMDRVLDQRAFDGDARPDRTPSAVGQVDIADPEMRRGVLEGIGVRRLERGRNRFLKVDVLVERHQGRHRHGQFPESLLVLPDLEPLLRRQIFLAGQVRQDLAGPDHVPLLQIQLRLQPLKNRIPGIPGRSPVEKRKSVLRPVDFPGQTCTQEIGVPMAGVRPDIRTDLSYRERIVALFDGGLNRLPVFVGRNRSRRLLRIGQGQKNLGPDDRAQKREKKPDRKRSRPPVDWVR